MNAAARSAFRLVQQIRCNGAVNVSKYLSDRTGMKVTIADVKGPLVRGYICLATETDSDDGLPHTLEHLVFMGSEKYPIKGFLDMIANRCLGSGTNAWTDTDHTCYTLSTAGSEGFLIMLPIYLDHILHPLLTQAQYITEVHHINGQGEDAGVVYCEMQEHESEMSTMVNRTLKQRMYPEGCGYRAETGGRLANLRTSTSHKKVADYHAAYYHSRNCEVFISGQVNHDQVFQVLDDVEKSCLDKKCHEKPFRRPWSSPVPALTIKPGGEGALDELVITCPSDDGESGVVSVGWRGPLIEKYYDFMALGILLKYLSTTAVAPLQRDFVQIEDPYCADVSACLYEQSETCVALEFQGVKKDKLKLIRPMLMRILGGIANGTEKIDMKRLDDLLRQAILQTENSMESKAHSTLASLVIGDFLYGNSQDDSLLRFDIIGTYEKLRKEPDNFWVQLLRQWLSLDRPHVCVIGEPSQDLVKALTEKEKARLATQKERLGEKGLEECEKRLDAAIEENEKNEPDSELMERCIVKTLKGIEFFPVQSTTNVTIEADGNSKFTLSELPFTAFLGDCAGTNFTSLTMQLDTSSVGEELRPLLFLWKALLFECPVLRDGKLVSYQDVVKELNRDLVSYDANYGICGLFYRIMSVTVMVDSKRYPNAVEWLNRLLYNVQFPVERVRVVAQRLINLAAEYKRDGHTVANFLIDRLVYEPRSQPVLNSVIGQESYLKKLLADLDADGAKVLDKLNELRGQITDQSRLILSVFCDSEKLSRAHSNPQDIIKKNFEFLDGHNKRHRAKVFGGHEPLYLKSSEKICDGVIASVGACESCYVQQTSPCSLRYQDADFAPLNVLIQYLTQLEGPIWREIRGRGLAYGANINLAADSGLLSLDLYRTADPAVAYEEMKRLVDEHLSDDASFDEDEFEGAKRSLIYSFIESEGTIQRAGAQSLLAYYRGLPQDFKKTILQRVFDVKMGEMVNVGRKYLPQLFDVKKSSVAITCHPSKLNEVVEGFSQLGRKLRIVTLDNEEFSI